MSRRILTLIALFVPLVLLVVLGFTVTVPFVAMGPGPTFNTLGEVTVEQEDGTTGEVPVVDVEGMPVDPVSGHLNMTTVAVRDQITLFDALGLWAGGANGVVPRDEVYSPGKSEDQIRQHNQAAFSESEHSAAVAAMRHLGLSEVEVKQVVQHSGAEGVLEPGDVITAVDGTEVSTASQLTDVISAHAPGDEVDVNFRRGDTDKTATMTLSAPSDPSGTGGVLGITVADTVPSDVDVTFNLNDIGGPSAGLMFSLALVDKLSPGELSGGEFVAGTGTIDPSGKVGPIGGIPYKMRAARDAGATVFLVPAGNCSEAARHAPDGLTLVKVDTLDDAISGLQALEEGRPAPHC
ncbi:PDZ domain-containing protein [Tomitella fengzijianii]|uniref:YlbL family protein n=1 Tax=Tomitella fengzijianii TaxID=2597660 RepID=UPI0018EF27F7|nr:PDZ domain-containing protein [Tomitella fengzijianii]